MLWAILIIVIIGIIVGPSIWVKLTLKRYSNEQADLPGTGGELARHLLHRFELDNVTVEATQEGRDHFDYGQHAIRLSPSVLQGHSLTAVAVAAHEVGHAIAHEKKEPIARLRVRYLPWANRMRRMASILLLGWPLISLAVHIPYAAPLHALVVFSSGFLAALIQLAILPEEWDASFNKALPILAQGEYVAPQDLPKVKRILTACAMTYVASALLSVLYVWRWFKR